MKCKLTQEVPVSETDFSSHIQQYLWKQYFNSCSDSTFEFISVTRTLSTTKHSTSNIRPQHGVEGVKSGHTGGQKIRLLLSVHCSRYLTNSTIKIMTLYMLHCLRFYSEDRCGIFLQNVSKFIPTYMESHHVFCHTVYLSTHRSSMYAHACMHAHMHAHARTHTRTHTHISSVCVSYICIHTVHHIDTHIYTYTQPFPALSYGIYTLMSSCNQ
jgi:hypothetical protein